VTTEQTERGETVKRTCRVIKADGKPCAKVYRVQKGSKAKGCPDCCPRLELWPGSPS
jgi:hypothetical protein